MRARPPTMEVIAGVSFRAKVVIQDMGTTINFTPIRATKPVPSESRSPKFCISWLSWDTSKWRPYF